MIQITETVISLDEMIKKARSKDAGAMVTFLGTVRDDGMEWLEVEAFREAALMELEAIQEEAMSRFHLIAAEVVHRTGTLAVGEDILAIVCSAAHPGKCFKAAPCSQAAS